MVACTVLTVVVVVRAAIELTIPLGSDRDIRNTLAGSTPAHPPAFLPAGCARKSDSQIIEHVSDHTPISCA